MEDRIGVEDFSNYDCEVEKAKGYCRVCGKETEQEIIRLISIDRGIEDKETGIETGKVVCQECYTVFDIDDFEEAR